MSKTRHDVKSWPDYFEPIASGRRKADLRKNDRDYKVGDLIRFREFDDRAGKYTGQEVVKEITDMVDGIGPGAITPLHGLQRGFCVLSLGDVQP